MNPQQAPTESVDVHWLFFDNSHSDNEPRGVDIPRSLFDVASQECQSLFAAEILKKFSFQALENTVKFWKPKETLLVDIVCEPGWTESIKEFHDSLKRIPLCRPLATALKEEIDNEDAVHLVVTAKGTYRRPGAVEIELPEVQRYHKIVSTPGKSPSVGAKSEEYASIQTNVNEAIHDGRDPSHSPFSTVAPPVQIFHPIFDQFIQLVSDPSVQPTNDEVRQAQELMHLLSAIGTQEPNRSSVIRANTKLMEILQVDVRPEPHTDGTSTDCGIQVLLVNNIRIPLFIMVLNRELGDAGCDPSTQAGLTMRRSWIQKDRKGIRDKCCCPTLMLVGGGPWLGVLGGVFTDQIIVQRLTDLMWVGHSSTEEDGRVYRFARVVHALRESLLQLQSYYTDIGKTASFEIGPRHSRYYPHPTSFTDENGQVVHFEYVKKLENDAACVVYQAKISSPQVDSRDIVVKFVSRYGIEAHKFLASHHYAPRLRYCGPLPGQYVPAAGFLPDSPAQSLAGLSLGPLQMVVMDYVSECKGIPPDARQQLEVVLEKLHSAGYAFGDLRNQNVLFDRENKVKLIDFDWAGRYDMNIRDNSLPVDLQKTIGTDKEHVKPVGNYVCYPLNLSRDIPWAEGVGDLEPIRPQHDWVMLARLRLLI
ncbi:hypothetical protein BDZ97DRAFT_1729574 [Flammula alnicola]|nr:hypothetical protein BDZ97DRAFT_1729574 [Flammula alnicola]